MGIGYYCYGIKRDNVQNLKTMDEFSYKKMENNLDCQVSTHTLLVQNITTQDERLKIFFPTNNKKIEIQNSKG